MTMLSLATVLAEAARKYPDKIAAIDVVTRVTYRELWDQTRAYAGALRDRGIARGDRVAMLIPNVPDFARVYYAALSLGAVVVPVHLLFKTDEIAFAVRDSGADLIVVGTHSRGAIEHFFVGSSAEKLVARSPLPVLTVRLPAGGAR